MFANFAKVFEEMAKSVPMLAGMMANEFSAQVEGQWLPGAPRGYENGKLGDEEKLMKVWREEAIPASMFEIPAGYKQKQMPMGAESDQRGCDEVHRLLRRARRRARRFADEIKKAYRRLAQKYHPDVSKEPGAEANFKEIAEAYQTLKDPEKRAAYDALGKPPAGRGVPPAAGLGAPAWRRQRAVLVRRRRFRRPVLALRRARLARAAFGGGGAMPGQDFEVPVEISIEDAFRGTTLSLSLSMPEYDAAGQLRRVPHTVKARIAPGAVDGQRLRLPGKGGKGFQGGRDGDLYLDISLKPHPLYRATGHDLYLDLPLAPWEAALGATVEVPTLAGPVSLKVPAGTSAGQKLRLAGRGLPKPRGGAGDLFAVAQIVVPAQLGERERELYEELAKQLAFNPRRHFGGGRMSIETEVLWLDEHRVVSLAELVEFSGLAKRSCSSSCRAARCRCASVAGGSYTFSARVVTVARTACRLRDDFELDMRGPGRGAAAARTRARTRRGNRAAAGAAAAQLTGARYAASQSGKDPSNLFG